MVAVNVIAADTDAEARRQFTSPQQAFLKMVRGKPGQLPPPVDSMDNRWSPAERAQVDQRTAHLGRWVRCNGPRASGGDSCSDRGGRAYPDGSALRPCGPLAIV